MDVEKYLDEVLAGATGTERVPFSGIKKRELGAFIRDVQSNAGIRPSHLMSFLKLIDDFYDASGVDSRHEVKDLQFENDRMTSNSFLRTESWKMCEEDHGNKKFHSLNSFNASAGPHGFFLSVRPFPVKWYLKHIEERMEERVKYSTAKGVQFMPSHNLVALAMLQIIEEEHDGGQNANHPFILPDPSGIFLGYTLYAGKRSSFNRINLIASNDIERMNFSPYAWTPAMSMVVRTFYGFDEMSPDMKLLRSKLQAFYKPAMLESLSLQIPFYMETKATNLIDEHPLSDSYIDAMVSLSDLMKTPLWRRAAKLPLHLRADRSAKFTFDAEP